MKVRTALLAIFTVLVCALAFSVIGVRRIRSVSMRSAAQIMNLTCVNSTSSLNDQLLEIEYSLDVISDYVTKNVPDAETVRADYGVFETHMESVQDYFTSLAAANPGIYAFYYRYMPEEYADKGGFFMISEERDGNFESVTVTDITQYDPDDVEHVGWYYIPKETGEPLWMDPYWNANDGTYTLSYVVPLKDDDGTVFGVVGMDLDFDAILADVGEITAYDSGYASLLSADGTVIWHRSLEAGTDIRTLGSELEEIAGVLAGESSGEEIYAYSYEGRDMELAFCSLRNGMRFALSVP